MYAATLNRFVDVGTKLGRWTAVISRAQNAYQLTATLNVTIGASTSVAKREREREREISSSRDVCVCTFRSNGAVAGQLSQSQSMYTGLVPSSIAFFDIANPSSNPQNLAVTITATQGNLSWVRCAAPLHIEALLSLTLTTTMMMMMLQLQLVSFRPQTCPVYTPFGIPDASQVHTAALGLSDCIARFSHSRVDLSLCLWLCRSMCHFRPTMSR